MDLGRALVLCLLADLGLLVLGRTVFGPTLTTVQVLCFLASVAIFFAWTFKTYNAIRNSPIRVFEEQNRRAQAQFERQRQAAADEARRLQRNARQRERRAERRALTEARIEQARAMTLARQQQPQAKPKTKGAPVPVATTEPKSRWDRLLEDDEE